MEAVHASAHGMVLVSVPLAPDSDRFNQMELLNLGPGHAFVRAVIVTRTPIGYQARRCSLHIRLPVQTVPPGARIPVIDLELAETTTQGRLLDPRDDTQTISHASWDDALIVCTVVTSLGEAILEAAVHLDSRSGDLVMKRRLANPSDESDRVK